MKRYAYDLKRIIKRRIDYAGGGKTRTVSK